jgi:hypothetical protein
MCREFLLKTTAVTLSPYSVYCELTGPGVSIKAVKFSSTIIAETKINFTPAELVTILLLDVED